MKGAFMARNPKKMVTGVFRNPSKAEYVFNSIRSMGYRDDEINLLMSDKTRASLSSEPTEPATRYEAGTKAAEGMGVGGAIGTAVGATLAGLAVVGSLAIPGLGLVIAGPLAAVLVGGGAGALTGGLIGALVGAGITEQSARAYEVALRGGGVVIGVLPRSATDAERLKTLFADNSGENICYC